MELLLWLRILSSQRSWRRKIKKRTMGMREGWLGKDPSTALEDGDFAIAAKMSECVCVCIMFLLRSIKQPEDQVEATAWEKLKRQGPTSKTNVGLWNFTVLCTKTPADCFTCQPFVTEPRQQRAVLYHTAALCGGQWLSRCLIPH